MTKEKTTGQKATKQCRNTREPVQTQRATWCRLNAEQSKIKDQTNDNQTQHADD